MQKNSHILKYVNSMEDTHAISLILAKSARNIQETYINYKKDLKNTSKITLLKAIKNNFNIWNHINLYCNTKDKEEKSIFAAMMKRIENCSINGMKDSDEESINKLIEINRNISMILSAKEDS